VIEVWSLADLIARLERAFVAISRAVPSFFGFPGSRPPAKTPEASVTQFGEYERVEESKYILVQISSAVLSVAGKKKAESL
jgi:hypothetical protein